MPAPSSDRRYGNSSSSSSRGNGGNGGYRGGRPNRRRSSKPVEVYAPSIAEDLPSTLPEGPMPSFEELGLAKPLLEALIANGIAEPFPIQAATLPDAMAGRDVLGRGQTGSGKTLAFGLALLTRLAGGRAKPLHPRASCSCPPVSWPCRSATP